MNHNDLLGDLRAIKELYSWFWLSSVLNPGGPDVQSLVWWAYFTGLITNEEYFELDYFARGERWYS